MKRHCKVKSSCVIATFWLFMAISTAQASSFREFILGNETPRIVEMATNSESASCMQCHDGSNAKSVAVKHADTAMTFTNHGSSNHPVGMYYAAYAQKDPASYATPASLDTRIKLENGKVTCISCHETKKSSSHEASLSSIKQVANVANTCTSTKSLTTGPSQTRLCMTCHSM